jgi:cytochrome b561
MMGLGKSKLHIPIQLVIFIVSLFGFFFGRLYGHSTPHLYTGNIHHSMGWVIFILLNIQLTAGATYKVAKAVQKPKTHHY